MSAVLVKLRLIPLIILLIGVSASPAAACYLMPLIEHYTILLDPVDWAKHSAGRVSVSEKAKIKNLEYGSQRARDLGDFQDEEKLHRLAQQEIRRIMLERYGCVIVERTQ